MSDITEARDALAKWRKRTAGKSGSNHTIAWALTRHAPLIVGTAGNPDLLDAIDALLAQEQRRRTSMHDNMSHDLSHHAARIADAIIAAEKRMSSE